ncbi:hypothetical protein ACEPPZ_18860 [Paracoccus yeei]|uniref:hypothetical protein n=1 Tax=Paracoccus yeei TaxID=147645 RepID=UPI0028D3D6C3|nr:hypothetical protein [Paracoccus yeei]
MNRTVEQTALLIAVILNRCDQNRARISAKTIKILGRRTNLRSAFVVNLIAELADRHEWIMFELATGGYGAVQAKALEAAKPVTAKRWLADYERKALRTDDVDWAALEDEVSPEENQDDEDD